MNLWRLRERRRLAGTDAGAPRLMDSPDLFLKYISRRPRGSVLECGGAPPLLTSRRGWRRLQTSIHVRLAKEKAPQQRAHSKTWRKCEWEDSEPLGYAILETQAVAARRISARLGAHDTTTAWPEPMFPLSSSQEERVGAL
jgi:hypothetical protein